MLVDCAGGTSLVNRMTTGRGLMNRVPLQVQPEGDRLNGRR